MHAYVFMNNTSESSRAFMMRSNSLISSSDIQSSQGTGQKRTLEKCEGTVYLT